jgi:predicted HicB family RNase H-like nuclease
MTLTLELPGDLERELAAEAERLGLSLDEYALRVLATRGGSGNAPRNGG